MADTLTFDDLSGDVFDHYKKPVTVTKVSGAPFQRTVLIYQCPLNVDWDGAPDAYGVDRPDIMDKNDPKKVVQAFPLQKNLDPHEGGRTKQAGALLGNGKGSDGTWSGVYSMGENAAKTALKTDPKLSGLVQDAEQRKLFGLNDGDGPEKLLDQFIDKRFSDANGTFPVVQIQKDAPKRGYYVSQCNALADASTDKNGVAVVKPWDQWRYVDASTYAYGALSDGLMNDPYGVKLFDYGVIMRNSTGMIVPFFFGDRAGTGSDKVGECSGYVKSVLAPEKDGEDNAFTFIVFPGSNFNNDADANATDLATHVPVKLGKDFARAAVVSQLLNVQGATNAIDLPLRIALGATTPAKPTALQKARFQMVMVALMQLGWKWQAPAGW